ncbi:MAG: dihydropteroate synthase [Bacteroidetes bacterium]|nr:dihydropteroate synthase [Bacteroidota bacterium]MBL6963848.1 dihydropteroate synthase [Bacteroidota bacterium]
MIKIKGKLFDLKKKRIMGILNLTPDSFYDGGKLKSVEELLSKAANMIQEGADILDVGGYSSRPGAAHISVSEELNRIIPAILEIKKKFPDSIISVDTFRSKVAEEAIRSGADIINDISAGDLDPRLPELMAEANVPYIIMHMQGTPANMQQNPNYSNITNALLSYFSDKLNLFNKMGINDIIIDPGFGFGKNSVHNYEILNKLSLFDIFQTPVLVGLSRKSMIYNSLQTTAENALNGTSILNTIALLNGASILRVHDVKEAVEAIKLVDLYLNPNKQ